MATITNQEAVEFTVIPADSIIHVTCEDVTLKEIEGRNGTWQKLEFQFRIDGVQAVGDGSMSTEDLANEVVGGKIWGSAPFRLVNSPENRLKQYVEALFGMEIGVGFELDTDLLLGKKARAVTTTYEKRTINPRTGKPYLGQQVETLLPLGAGASAPEPALAGAASVQDEEPPF